MAIEYEFTRINPLCTCEADGSDTKTHTIEVSMRATETGAGGKVFEAYANGEVPFSGEGCIDPEAIDLGTVLNDYATANDWKANLAASLASQQEVPHEWTGHLEAPSVT